MPNYLSIANDNNSSNNFIIKTEKSQNMEKPTPMEVSVPNCADCRSEEKEEYMHTNSNQTIQRVQYDLNNGNDNYNNSHSNYDNHQCAYLDTHFQDCIGGNDNNNSNDSNSSNHSNHSNNSNNVNSGFLTNNGSLSLSLFSPTTSQSPKSPQTYQTGYLTQQSNQQLKHHSNYDQSNHQHVSNDNHTHNCYQQYYTQIPNVTTAAAIHINSILNTQNITNDNYNNNTNNHNNMSNHSILMPTPMFNNNNSNNNAIINNVNNINSNNNNNNNNTAINAIINTAYLNDGTQLILMTQFIPQTYVIQQPQQQQQSHISQPPIPPQPPAQQQQQQQQQQQSFFAAPNVQFPYVQTPIRTQQTHPSFQTQQPISNTNIVFTNNNFQI